MPVALVGVGPGRDQIIWTEAGRASAAAARRHSRLARIARVFTREVVQQVARFSSSAQRATSTSHDDGARRHVARRRPRQRA